MERYTLGWWEPIKKNNHIHKNYKSNKLIIPKESRPSKIADSCEWQEIKVMAYSESHAMEQIENGIIDKIKKGLKDGTTGGLILYHEKPLVIEKLI